MGIVSDFLGKLKGGAEVFTDSQAREEAFLGIKETFSPTEIEKPEEEKSTVQKAAQKALQSFNQQRADEQGGLLKEQLKKPAKEIVPIEPTPLKPISLIDIAREIPESAATVRNSILGFVKGVQEEIARSGALVGLTLTGVEELDISGEEVENKVARFIFGNRPLESIETLIAKTELTVQDFARQLQQGQINLPIIQDEKKLGQKLETFALPISFLAIGGVIALDFTGFGGGKKQVIELLAKSTDLNFVAKTLRGVGVADDLILPISEKIVKTSDKKVIDTILKNTDEIQKISKVAKDSLGIVDDVVPKITEPSFDLSTKTVKDLTEKVVEVRHRGSDILIENTNLSKPQIVFDDFHIKGLRDRTTKEIVNWDLDKSINASIPAEIKRNINDFIKAHNTQITKIDPLLSSRPLVTPSPELIIKIADKHGIKVVPKAAANAFISKEGVDISFNVSAKNANVDALKFLNPEEQTKAFKQFKNEGGEETKKQFLDEFSDSIFDSSTGKALDITDDVTVTKSLRPKTTFKKPVEKEAKAILTTKERKIFGLDGGSSKTLTKELDKTKKDKIRPGEIKIPIKDESLDDVYIKLGKKDGALIKEVDEKLLPTKLKLKDEIFVSPEREAIEEIGFSKLRKLAEQGDSEGVAKTSNNIIKTFQERFFPKSKITVENNIAAYFKGQEGSNTILDGPIGEFLAILFAKINRQDSIFVRTLKGKKHPNLILKFDKKLSSEEIKKLSSDIEKIAPAFGGDTFRLQNNEALISYIPEYMKEAKISTKKAIDIFDNIIVKLKNKGWEFRDSKELSLNKLIANKNYGKRIQELRTIDPRIQRAFEKGRNADFRRRTSQELAERFGFDRNRELDEAFGIKEKISKGVKPPVKPPIKITPGELDPENFGLYKDFKNTASKKWLSLREFFEDDWIRVKKILSRKDVNISDASDVYTKRKLMSGKVDTRIRFLQDVEKKIDKDILNTSKKLNIDDEVFSKDVNNYLHAKHAPERNAQLTDGAAGITTKEANAIVKEIEALPHIKEIKKISQQILKINRETLDILLEGEVIDQTTHTLLRETYKNHVPLQRVLNESEDIITVLSGKSLDVRGTGLFKAKGSERPVRDIFSNIIANHEAAIVRAEKNIIDNATFQFHLDNPHLNEIFEQIKPKAIGRAFAKENEEGRIILETITDPSVLAFRRKGKATYLRIKDPQLAVAFRGVNREKVDGLFKYVGFVTKWYASLATRFNPEFALPNKIRDMQEVMVYLSSQKDIGKKGAVKVLSEDRKSYSAILDAIRGKDTEGARLYNELKLEGGTTGGLALSTRQQIELDVKKIRRLNRSNVRKGTEFFLKKVEEWNTIFEDSTRLTVYRISRARGLSKQRSAVLAKEASIDFNKFGTGGPIINSLYMFSNASIQGSTKMIRSMKDPKVAGTVIMAVSVPVFVVGQWNDKHDPKWQDKISKWDKLNGLNVVLPPGEDGEFRYISIPVSWGLKPIKVAADFAYDAIAHKNIKIGEVTEGVFTSLIEGYNPIGGTDALSAVLPTLFDWPVDIKRNRAWYGNKIRPDWDKHAPNSILYFEDLQDSAMGRAFIGFSDKLSQVSDRRIEISPADLNYAAGQLIGGAGRFTSKTIKTIEDIADKSVPETREIPFASRFLRSIPEDRLGADSSEVEYIKSLKTEESRERFHLKQMAEQTYQEMKKIPRAEALEEFKKLNIENRELANEILNVWEEESAGLNYTDRLTKGLGVTNGDRARYIHSELKKLKTNKQKRDLWIELVEKKIITGTVGNQIQFLMEQEGGAIEVRQPTQQEVPITRRGGILPSSAFK